MRRAAAVALALCVGAVVTGCGSSSPHSTGSTAPVLTLASNPKLGRFLVTRGYTLYMYPPDKRRSVTCTKAYDCATAWPPLFVKAGQVARAGAGVDQTLISSVPGDGGRVVTYNKWPLYYYEGDRKPGQVNGQDQSFDWFVLDASGTPVHTGPVSTG
jgi:predicted lipoprotein with Yx(FWY)xxD motif